VATAIDKVRCGVNANASSRSVVHAIPHVAQRIPRDREDRKPWQNNLGVGFRRGRIQGATDMDDGVQNGLQSDQWLSTVEKGEKRASSLGSGALRFIRTRSSIRRELKRQCHR